MTEYQERRAQYLRDAHDWAEDGDLPDASADYEPITVQDIAKIYEVPLDLLETATGSLEHAEEIRQAYLRGYEEGREAADERAAAFLIAADPDEWDPEDVARAISDGDHHK